jgi:NAD(P)-dependent dehydrogenase (short-subunit alcohol dehydrogenase family)
VTVICQEADVRDQDEVNAFVKRAEQQLDGLHILVNNAGIGRDRALWRMDADEWKDVVDTNLTGAFYMIRAIAPRSSVAVPQDREHRVRARIRSSSPANYASSKAV